MNVRNPIKWLLVLLIFVCPGTLFAQSDLDDTISLISANIAKEIAEKGNIAIAVANFTDLQGSDTQLGRFIAEEFSITLTEIRRGYDVVDRSRINYLLEERGLTASGLVNPEAAIELGKVAGVQALLTGTITAYGDNLRMAVKVIDLERATILAADRADFARTQTLDDLDRPLSSNVRRPNRSRSQQSSPSNERDGFIFTHDSFEMRLLSVERINRDVKFTIEYVNLQDNAHRAAIAYEEQGAKNIAVNYLLDQNGDKFGYKQGSLLNRINNYPANVPMRMWITFANVSESQEHFTLFLLWSYYSNRRWNEIPVHFNEIYVD